MTKVDITIEICGMSGNGTIAAGGILNQAMSRAGFSVIAFDSYPAEIRGFGRCIAHSRIGDEVMQALSDKINVLISLDDQQSLSRIPFLAEKAFVLFDNKPPVYVEENRSLAAHIKTDAQLIGMPMTDISAGATGSTRGRNICALGGFASFMGIPPEFFHKAIEKKFIAKGKKILEANLKSFDEGYFHVKEKKDFQPSSALSVPKKASEKETILISGNDSIVRGALDADLKLFFGYPITPATPIMESLAKLLPERGGKVVQMEDEIASIGAVLGSFYAGKRAMTATSGPGFALMTELITHGIMAEIPAVILNAQRAGPSTGLPTKTEQSDLQSAVFGGPGDSARIVLAPTNVMECYEFTLKSFQIAERYQTPVIILTDFFLNNRVESIKNPAASPEELADGNIYPEESEKENYSRYRDTKSGISPRAVPGIEGYLYNATGLEHSEKGDLDFSPENHMKMSEKRHRKIYGALVDLPVPVEALSSPKMDLGVIAWGSTYGAALEAVQKTKRRKLNVGLLKITSIFPYHANVIQQFMERCDKILIPELNYEGQLANLIGHLYKKRIIRLNRATGIPMSANVILEKIETCI